MRIFLYYHHIIYAFSPEIAVTRRSDVDETRGRQQNSAVHGFFYFPNATAKTSGPILFPFPVVHL